MWQEKAKRYTIEKSKTIHAEAFEKKKDLDPTKGLATAQMASRLYILVRPTPLVIRFWFIYAALCCSLSHHWHNLKWQTFTSGADLFQSLHESIQ